MTDSYLYDSFGNILLSSGSTINPFQFVGQAGYYQDLDLVLYHLRARHYDPASGRFTSRDPVYEPVRPSWYGYAWNNPALIVDPSGFQPPVPQPIHPPTQFPPISPQPGPGPVPLPGPHAPRDRLRCILWFTALDTAVSACLTCLICSPAGGLSIPCAVASCCAIPTLLERTIYWCGSSKDYPNLSEILAILSLLCGIGTMPRPATLATER